MSNILDIIKRAISTEKNFYYCFDIILKSGSRLCLTSADHTVNIECITYSPRSGLIIKQGSFNDSGQDYIVLEGIYEQHAIDNVIDLTDAIIKILICGATNYYHFVTYRCTIYTKFDLNFTLYLQPETIKYNQTVINCFSKTCRTNFGDLRCKVDKSNFSSIYDIVEITNRNIKLLNMDRENGYYTGGDAKLIGSNFGAKILSNFNANIQIDRIISDDLKNLSKIMLTAGCDKSFITCCNKFNNAVNFRGEPFVPEDDFLEVN